MMIVISQCGAAVALAAILALALPSAAQTSPQNAMSTPARIGAWSTTTNSSGAWSLTIPANAGYTTAPVITVTALSADATLPNQAVPQMTAPTISSGVVTVPGTVSIPNTQLVAGAPFKAAGAGIVVQVHTVGY